MNPKRPITVLGAGRRSNAPVASSGNMVYAFIPFALGLPLVATLFAKIYHVSIGPFTPLLFIFSGLAMAAIFYVATEAQKAERIATRKAKLATAALKPPQKSSVILSLSKDQPPGPVGIHQLSPAESKAASPAHESYES